MGIMEEITFTSNTCFKGYWQTTRGWKVINEYAERRCVKCHNIDHPLDFIPWLQYCILLHT
jgi:hypothetical protein